MKILMGKRPVLFISFSQRFGRSLCILFVLLIVQWQEGLHIVVAQSLLHYLPGLISELANDLIGSVR